MMMPMTSWAGNWEQKGTQWKYKEDSGEYAVGKWIEEQGKAYYLDENGIMLANTRTPDNREVDSSGA